MSASMTSRARRRFGQIQRRLTMMDPVWPDEVLFFLTHRCNLRCKMCGQWSEGGYARQHPADHFASELSAAAYAPTIRELARFRPRVILCGGEVLLYPELPEFLDLLSKSDLPYTLITNGTHLESAVDLLLESGLQQLIISIDGPKDLHDSIRGRAGTYERALDGIKAMLDARGERATPTVGLNTTITKESWRSLPDVVDLAEDLGLDSITLLHPNFLDATLYDQHKAVFAHKVCELGAGWDGFVQDFGEFDSVGLSETVQTILQRPTQQTSVVFLPEFSASEIHSYYRNGPFRGENRRPGCLGPRHTVSVGPDGEVSPCLGYSVGNIATDSFGDIWRGEKLRTFRHLVEAETAFPACTRCCTYYRY